jgi:hypothetical protein
MYGSGGSWCNIVLNWHAATEKESADSKDRFYEELRADFPTFS